MRRIEWTPELDNLLHAWAAEVPPVSITDQAKRLEVSRASIAKRRKQLGIISDRNPTAAANEARRVDAAAIRAELEVLLLQDAARLRQQMWEPTEYIDHGGKDYIQVRWTLEQAAHADKLKLMQAAGLAVDRSLKISEHDTGNGNTEAISMLGGIAKLLEQAAASMPEDGPQA